jgi:hypothetical protein
MAPARLLPRLPLFWAALLLLPFAHPAAAAQVGDACSSSSGGGCGSGLHCSPCGAGGGSICTRASPVDPATHGTGLPFNNYSWLTTHNSYALAGAASATGSALITETNQEDTVTAQLKVTQPVPVSSIHLPPGLSTAEASSGRLTASAFRSDAGAAGNGNCIELTCSSYLSF